MENNIISIKPCKKVATKHTDGSPNGWLLEGVSEPDGFTEGTTRTAYTPFFKTPHL